MVDIKKIFTLVIFLITVGFSLEIKINDIFSLNHNLKIYIPTDNPTLRTAYRYMDITYRNIYFGFTLHEYYDYEKHMIMYLNTGIKFNFGVY